MNILCIDTATEACSAALLHNTNTDGIFELCPQQQSQRILPMIDELLTRNKVKLEQLDAIAYGRGPGSFTGVRIASSTAQGLALGTELPVIEVSTLAAMAQENFERFGIKQSLALIDARMSEVYCAEYLLDESNVVKLVGTEAVMPPSQIKDTLTHYPQVASYVGTGFDSYAEDLGLNLQKDELKVHYPNARYMLSLAVSQFANHEAVAVENIQPVYLRDKVTWKKLPNRD